MIMVSEPRLSYMERAGNRPWLRLRYSVIEDWAYGLLVSEALPGGLFRRKPIIPPGRDDHMVVINLTGDVDEWITSNRRDRVRRGVHPTLGCPLPLGCTSDLDGNIIYIGKVGPFTSRIERRLAARRDAQGRRKRGRNNSDTED